MADDDRDYVPFAGGVYKRAPLITPAELRAIMKAVDDFVDRLARIDRPGFAADVAKGKKWVFGVALEHWLLAQAVDVALFPRTEAHTVDHVNDPYDERRRIGFNGLPWGGVLHDALLRLEAVMEGVIARWDVAEIYDDEFRFHQGVILETGQTIPPILEDDEIAALRWISEVMARALADSEWREPIVCYQSVLLKALGKSPGYTDYLDGLRDEGRLEFEDPPLNSKGRPLIVPIAFRFTDPEEHRRVWGIVAKPDQSN